MNGIYSRRMRQIGIARMAFTVLFLLMAVMVARFSWSIPLLDFAERALYDIRASLTTPLVLQDQRITLVVYNDDTLRKLEKRSPLDRAILASALINIDAMLPRSIGIDILIDQPQREDEALIATLRALQTPTFLAFASADSNAEQMDYEQEQWLRRFQQRLTGSNAGPASIRLETDRDNVVRAWPQPIAGEPPMLVHAMLPGQGQFQHYSGSIRFARPAKADEDVFNRIPIELLADPAMKEALTPVIAGRHILIGGDINDLDQFDTPDTWRTGKTEIGLAVHAHLLAQMLDGHAPAPIGQNWLLLAAVLVMLSGTFASTGELRPWHMALLLTVQALMIIALPVWLHRHGFDTLGLPVVGWLAGWLLAYAAAGTAARSVGAEQRRFAQSTLGKYLPRDVANEILKNPDRLSLSGEKREIYALFTDLEGFTKLSHAISPEMVAQLLNRYLDMLSDVVLRHGGTIDKFVGDAVVAFWGAPLSRPDDADNAVRAAIAMHEAGERFRAEAPAGVPPIGITRVGLHFGEAIIGNFGGEGRIQYTALGDSMNAASRLESANKTLKTGVLVSEAVVERTSLHVFRPMGRIVVRGRSTPIAVYEPVSGEKLAAADELSRLLESFDAGDAQAMIGITAMATRFPDDAAMAKLVERLKQTGTGGSYDLD